MTWVFESIVFDFFTDWERMVKICLKRPQCGRHPKKFSHIDTNVARYVMVLGENGGVGHRTSSESPGRRGAEGAKKPVDVGGEQYTLTQSRLRLHLPLRQPCCTLGDQPGLR